MAGDQANNADNDLQSVHSPASDHLAGQPTNDGTDHKPNEEVYRIHELLP